MYDIATNMEITGLPAAVKVAIEALLEENELSVENCRRREIDSDCSATDFITTFCHRNAHNRVQEENAW